MAIQVNFPWLDQKSFLYINHTLFRITSDTENQLASVSQSANFQSVITIQYILLKSSNWLVWSVDSKKIIKKLECCFIVNHCYIFFVCSSRVFGYRQSSETKNFVDPQSSFRRLHQIVFEERTVNIISNIQALTKCFSLVW